METRCDIAVVGGGAAGLAAAIAAVRAARAAGVGADVAVLESADRVGRTILKTGNGRCNFTNEYISNGAHVGDYHNAPFVHAALDALLQAKAAAAHAAPAPGTQAAAPAHTAPAAQTAAAAQAAPAAAAHAVPVVLAQAGETSDQAASVAIPLHGSSDCADPVLTFFEDMGLAWRQEGEGRRYPLANKASVVVDVLRAEAARLGVREMCSTQVVAIEAPRGQGSPFTLRLADGVFWRAGAVIVACGGAAVGRIDACGVQALPASPVLGPLRCSDESCAYTRELDNIRVRCSVALADADGKHLAAAQGELLFRTYGVSGICIFDLSRVVRPGDTLLVNLLPIDDPADAIAYLSTRRETLEAQQGPLVCGSLLRGLVLPRVADVVLKAAGLGEGSPADDAALEALASTLSTFPLEVAGMGPADQCQVQRGGLPVSAFDPATMEARDTPGLFACGEALDVDGPCGGYNLHWAWASGLLAGTNAGKHLC